MKSITEQRSPFNGNQRSNGVLTGFKGGNMKSKWGKILMVGGLLLGGFNSHARGKDDLRCGLGLSAVVKKMGVPSENYRGNWDYFRVDFGDVRMDFISGELFLVLDCSGDFCKATHNCALPEWVLAAKEKQDAETAKQAEENNGAAKAGKFLGAAARAFLFKF